MPITTLDALAAALPKEARLLGFDLGTKTIGLALSDPGRSIASPLVVLKRTKLKPDAARLAAIIREHGVGGLVLGLPINMDGSDGPRAQATRAFARNLTEVIDLPLAFWDERLSTAAVERALTDEADLSRARRAQLVDKLAAAYILQGALDFLRRRPPQSGR
ncbi:MAG: Holliday junction resolvase RuvX [Alphaproteobacteria bacterium]|nr:Holliday junction resolvase RuvX [Alphaproteobacteria bacterium]